MIRATGLTVRRGNRVLAGPVDLAVGPGEAVLLAGASGSGKSTLLRAVAGVLPPEFAVSGVVESGQTGYVPQNPSHALLCARVSEEVRAAGRTVLASLGGERLIDRQCRELSSGEAQRVALAAAIGGGAHVLLLDEPTAFLDPAGVGALGAALARLKSEGIGLLITEHRPERLPGFFDRTVALSEVGVPEPESVDSAEIGEAVLRAERIGHSFGARRVLDGVDLELRAGERVAISGANGSGKTTLGRILAGLLKPRSGLVTMCGRRVRPGLDAGLTPPDPDEALLGETVAEELALGPENLGLPHRPDLLVALGLEGRAAEAPASLSHGTRVRLVVGATLAASPRVLILDEPTVGADAFSMDRLLRLLAGYPGAVVAFTHDEAFTGRFATRTLRLEGGRLGP